MNTAPDAFVVTCLVLLGLLCLAALWWLTLRKPRLLLYAILALAPTQFIFIPVSDFYISPADVLVLTAAAGLLFRLAVGELQSWKALDKHLFLGLMVVAYAVGFLALDHFSRTLVRVPMAIVPSVLACELLRTRAHLARGTVALVAGGIVDAGYGLYFYANGVWLHPTRFSGMMGVNFTATVVATAAVIAFARLARTRQPIKLVAPALLTAVALATFSKMGLIALTVAWIGVLWWVFSRSNRKLVVSTVVAIAIVGISLGSVRQLALAWTRPGVMIDGVVRSSTDVRWLMLRAIWRGVSDRPLVGVGYLNFEKYSTIDPEIRASTGGAGFATHNTYLEVLVEGGLMAFIPFLLHFVQYRRGAREAWRLITRDQDVVVAASLVGLPVMLVAAALSNVLLQYVFWSVCGLALASLTRIAAEAVEQRRSGPGPALP
jgi:O-antigen ligase